MSLPRAIKVFTGEEMGRLDRATFSELGLPSRAVMESAGREIASLILDVFSEEVVVGVGVLAGGGNNGGDGYVIARTLSNVGVPTKVYSLKSINDLTGDCQANFQSYINSGGEVVELNDDNWLEVISSKEFGEQGLIVDAIYGTGFRGEIKGFVGEVVSYLNGLGIPTVSVDLPSGVEADTGRVSGVAVQAAICATLQAPKIGNIVFPGRDYCGDTFCLDIGVSKSLPEYQNINRKLLSDEAVAEALQRNLTIHAEIHKGTRGHVLVIGGSAGHLGAPQMSSYAALKTASGMASVVLPSSSALIAPKVEELMCFSLDADSAGHFSGKQLDDLSQRLQGKQAVVLGPGIGQSAGAAKVVTATLKIVRKQKIPTVVDADALNLVASDNELKNLLSELTVLTPHPGEMARLLGVSTDEVQDNRLELAVQLSVELNTWVVLKGAITIIAGPNSEIFISPIACSALATAGSGDVLAGVIASLLGASCPIDEAIAAAVYLHGVAGEEAAAEKDGPQGVSAGDVIEVLPYVYNQLLTRQPDGSRLCTLLY